MTELDDAFLNRVTHDLRGELATMVAGVHYMMRYEGGVSAPGRQMLERVERAGQRLRRLLDELELGGWIGGERTADAAAIEPCRVEILVHAALGRLEWLFTQRAAHADLSLPSDLPEIEADPELSGIAIELIIDFAVSRSPGGSVEITASSEGGFITLGVRDHGGAIDPAALARIFEPFFERDLVPRPEPGGRRRERLGLGLSIAHGVARAHGGSLQAAVEGDGIALTLRLRTSGCPAVAAV